MNSTQSQELAKTLSASGALAALFVRVTGLAAAFAAIGLYVGWRDLTSYYSKLGAGWVVETLPTGRFIHQGAGLLGIAALFALAAIFSLSQGAASARGLRRWSIVLGLAGAALLFPGAAFRSDLTPSTLHLLSTLSAFLFVASVGLAMGELVALLAVHSLEWSGYMLYLVQFAVLFGLLYAPGQVGTSRAEMHLDPASSALPRVQLAGPTSGLPHWRLIAALDGSMLIMAHRSNGQRPIFRLVAPADVVEIHP